VTPINPKFKIHRLTDFMVVVDSFTYLRDLLIEF